MSTLELIFIRPIEHLLEVLFELFSLWTGSYGWSLILMSLAVTLFTAPLYYLAEKWKKEEQTIRARMARDLRIIKSHYTGQKRFYLVKNLHRLHGYRSIYSLRTSLGLFVQIPFFFAAYRYLSSFQGYIGEGFLFITDLGRPDALLWGINALPILMTAVNLVSSMIYTRSRSAKESAQLFALALLFLAILYRQPAGLLIYWTMNNVFSLLKNALFESPGDEHEKDEPGLTAAIVALAKKYVTRKYSPQILFVVMILIVGGQSHWLYRFDKTFKYAILLTAVLGSILSLVSLVRYVRLWRSRIDRSYIAPLVVSWALFLFFAYLLLYERRQSAYLSNPNMKLIAVLIQDGILYLNAKWLLGPTAGEQPEAISESHGRIFAMGSTFLSAYLFVLSPMVMYFSSPDDVGMRLGALLARNVPWAIGLTLVAMGLYKLVGTLGRRRAVEAVLAALMITFIYGYVVPGDFGIVDEFQLEKAFLLDEIRLSRYVLDIIVLGGAYFFVKYALRTWSGIVTGVLVAFMVAFGAHAIVSVARMDRSALVFTATEAGSELPPESDKIHTFSKDGRNVVLLVADMFNGNYMARLLEEYPEYAARLEDFTWYSNTLSIASHSATSLPGVLGGRDYAPEKMNAMPGTGAEKIAKAAGTFYDAAVGHDFDVALVDPLYVNQEMMEKDYRGRVETTRSATYAGYWQRTRGVRTDQKGRSRKNQLLVMVTVFQSMPYMMKARVYDDGSWIIFRKSYQFDYIAGKTVRNYGYLDLLPDISRADNGRSSIKLIHSQLTHEPFGVTREGNIINQEFPDPQTRSFTDGTSAYYSAKKLIDFVLAWTDWMKRAGVYDNTYLLITADHGNNAMDTDLRLPKHLDTLANRHETSRANVLLMTKGFNASGPFRIDDRLMSNSDTPAMVLGALGDNSTYGHDPTSIRESREASFSYLRGDWKNFLESEVSHYSTYVVDGNIYQPEDWSKR